MRPKWLRCERAENDAAYFKMYNDASRVTTVFDNTDIVMSAYPDPAGCRSIIWDEGTRA